MQICHVFRDEPIVGGAEEGKVKIHLNWVCQVRTANSVRTEMECCISSAVRVRKATSGTMMDSEELKTTIESAGDKSRLAGVVVAPAEYSGETTKNGRSG